MKSLLKFFVLLFVLSVTIVSCEKDEPSSSSNANSSLSNNVLSGKIDLFTNGSTSEVKALLCQTEDTTCVGHSAITSDGSFSITLSTPATSDLMNFSQMILSNNFIGTISTPNAMVSNSSLGFCTYLNGAYSGNLIKTNFNNSQNKNSKGAAWIEFMYCDRELKVSGKLTNTFDEGTDFYTIHTVNLNFTFKKGWNELVCRSINYTKSTTGSVVEEYSMTNDIPNDLKWRLFSTDLWSARIENPQLKIHSLDL